MLVTPALPWTASLTLATRIGKTELTMFFVVFFTFHLTVFAWDSSPTSTATR